MTVSRFMVSIHCMTYNHAPYIEDAMNGFCMQQTTFPFVAIIVDDASTDGEPEVIKNYLNEHFNMRNALTWETDDANFIEAQHKENLNCSFAIVLLKYNFRQAEKAKGPLIKKWTDTKYISICEGDDYWIASDKLDKQINYLIENPSYSMCFHSVNYINKGQITGNDIKNESDCDFTTEDIIIGGGTFCSTCSLVIEQAILQKNYIFKKMADVGDFPLQIICALEGKIHYFSQLMGCYRVSTPGSWTQRTNSQKDVLFRHIRNEMSWLRELDYETKFKYRSAIHYRLIIFAQNYLGTEFVTYDEFVYFFSKVKLLELKKDYRKEFLLLYFRYKMPIILNLIKLYSKIKRFYPFRA